MGDSYGESLPLLQRKLARPGVAGAILSVFLLTGGCSVSSGEGESVCAVRVVFQQRTYTERANVPFATGKELGKGQLPDCDDGEDQDGAASDPEQSQTGTETRVYEIEGLDSQVAVAADALGQRIFFVIAKSGGEIPEEVQKFIDESRPTSTGESPGQ